MNKGTNILLWVFAIIVFTPLLVGIINLYLLVNLIESPLPESEEVLPDTGLVDK